jgi:hypothetical protein
MASYPNFELDIANINLILTHWLDYGGGSGTNGGGGNGSSSNNENCFLPETFDTIPCEEEEKIRICHTRDIHLDHPAVQHKMEEIWNTAYGADDNSPLPQSERRESLWAIEWRGGSDYRFHPYTGGEITSCTMRNISIKVGNYIVGYLHVEPFSSGEVITDQACLDAKGYSNGSYNATRISPADLATVNQTGKPMYVMDKGNIKLITPGDSTFQETYSRCGY